MPCTGAWLRAERLASRPERVHFSEVLLLFYLTIFLLKILFFKFIDAFLHAEILTF